MMLHLFPVFLLTKDQMHPEAAFSWTTMREEQKVFLDAPPSLPPGGNCPPVRCGEGRDPW